MMVREQFWRMVSESQSIVITSHLSADDDSISSVLATYWLIKQKTPDKKIAMIYSGELENGRYKSFENYEKIKYVPDVVDYLDDCDLLIMVDGREWSRFSNDSERLSKFSGRSISIDHHKSNHDSFDLEIFDEGAASTADIIYRKLLEEEPTNRELVRIFLLGILGDTGNFSYLQPEQLEVMEIGKKLLFKLGQSMESFNTEYSTISKAVFELISELMKNTEFKPETNGWPEWQMTGVSRDFVKERGLSETQVSLASHLYMDSYLRWINGYRWGVVFTPRNKGSYNLSLRSCDKSVNVRKIAEKTGNGGGHDLASGGAYWPEEGKEVKLKEAQEKFEKWLLENTLEDN